MADKSRKILVVRFSSIGDMVLTSSVVRCLSEQLEDAEIHYVTKARYAELVEHNPRIAKIHVLQDDGLQALVKRLRKEQFDFVVDLHNSLRSRLLRIRLGVKGKSFPKLNIQKWLLVNFKINRLPDQHIVDRYFEAAQPLGVKNDGGGLECHLPPELSQADRLLQELPKSFVAIAIGGNYPTKKLPTAKLIEMVSALDVPCVLLGGPEDTEAGAAIAEQTNAISACGQLSLLESAKLVKESAVTITHDTGMMHIAAAFQVPVMSIWGNTVTDFGMSPYFGSADVTADRSSIFEVQNLNCRPCSKLGHSKCPKGHFRCMQEQDVKRIALKTMETIEQQ